MLKMLGLIVSIGLLIAYFAMTPFDKIHPGVWVIVVIMVVGTPLYLINRNR
jgi:hypothetical protein